MQHLPAHSRVGLDNEKLISSYMPVYYNIGGLPTIVQGVFLLLLLLLVVVVVVVPVVVVLLLFLLLLLLLLSSFYYYLLLLRHPYGKHVNLFCHNVLLA